MESMSEYMKIWKRDKQCLTILRYGVKSVVYGYFKVLRVFEKMEWDIYG